MKEHDNSVFKIIEDRFFLPSSPQSHLLVKIFILHNNFTELCHTHGRLLRNLTKYRSLSPPQIHVSPAIHLVPQLD